MQWHRAIACSRAVLPYRFRLESDADIARLPPTANGGLANDTRLWQLANNTRLCKLDMDNTHIGDEGLADLCDMLRVSTRHPDQPPAARRECARMCCLLCSPD